MQHRALSFGKNRDLAVPFWSTKDAGQKPFTFTIGQGAVIKARSAARHRSAQHTVQPPPRASRSVSPDYRPLMQAWDEGVATMQIGEVAKITATPDYACVAVQRIPPLSPRRALTQRGAQLRRGRLPCVGHHAQLDADLRD